MRIVMKPKLHTKSEGSDNVDLQINLKYFPGVAIGDILEIYHENQDYSHLLLQVTRNYDELKDSSPLSLEQTLAAAFQISKYKDVVVNKIHDLKEITLDLVELLFKDQYYNRSDMWHMRSHLVGTCTYLNMSVQHTEMRAQVCEMWAKGEQVTCGLISEDTRIVYRSLTAVIQIFIQMSSEMWEFDNYGDLYFEKAVGGFLCDLFDKWKEKKCTHDVTIVLFSRTFFDAPSIESFPEMMRECLQEDHKGRIYEDYYRVVIQNERYDDWNHTHVKLREMFNSYLDNVMSYHRRHGNSIPQGYNSIASQGNFLETLNMALSLFEKSYLDRSFDRTGQVAIVITPGAGVFEVDRELCNITKQRTIDCGVGSDLVCVGEQPLHAVPLFKFHNKTTCNTYDMCDDYNIPHWMNHSFYTSRSQSKCLANSRFVPRIKPPQIVLDKIRNGECNDRIFHPPQEVKILHKGQTRDDNLDFIDYDEYDAQIFKPTPRSTNKPGFHPQRSKSFFVTSISRSTLPQTVGEAKRLRVPRDRHISDTFSDTLNTDGNQRSVTQSVKIPVRMTSRDSSGTSSVGCYPVAESSQSMTSLESEDTAMCRPVVGSAGSTVGRSKTLMCLHNFRPNRALINPFAPSRMHFKMTSNRRRWVHAFPINPKGAAVQTHHVHSPPVDSDEEGSVSANTNHIASFPPHPAKYQTHLNRPPPRPDHSNMDTSESTRSISPVQSITSSLKVENTGNITIDMSPSSSYQTPSLWVNAVPSMSTSTIDAPGRLMKKLKTADSQPMVYIWGGTGEQEWSPEIATGHDWRPLDEQEAANEQSHLVKPILSTAIHPHKFCATISVDWKSLVIPASLPITTDYFPDSRCLDDDYVQNQYSITDDDCFTDDTNDWSEGNTNKPSRSEQLFYTMISQRIGQGFQLVVKPKQTVTQISSEHPQYDHVAGLRRARTRDDSKNKYHLSIGRVFHVLELTGCSITVRRYRPRHPQPRLRYNYSYRFQAPDSYTYDVSWTQFGNAMLENYNWNYLDQYLLTRGSEDYGLIESLKYWRSRFFLLPCNTVATKKILEDHPRCDVYEEKTNEELQDLTVQFLRFTEILNSVKRSQSRRRSNPHKVKKSVVESNDQTTASSQVSSCEPKKASSTSTQASADPVAVVNSGGEPNTDRVQETSLSSSSRSSLLVEAMLDSSDGVTLFDKPKSLPPESFISADVVDWCISNISDISDIASSCRLMQRLIDEGFLCHTSGERSHPFIYGFYIYTFTTNDNIKWSSSFSTDWWEIRIPASLENSLIGQHHDASDNALKPVPGPCSSSTTASHKYYNLDIAKEPCDEWASVRYHALYDPRCAFEVQLHWLVATGCVLAEIISTWARHIKARVCFHLLPVPIDPFALPHTENSDPLRGPIFIPIEYRQLPHSSSLLGIDNGHHKMMQLQHIILKRFGFMPIQSHDIPSTSASNERNQYVHCTGGMFALIPDMHPDKRETNVTSGSSSPCQISLLQRNYIARLTVEHSGALEPSRDDAIVGFLWSWNYMSSSRWRTLNTGHGEWFQDKMLADFRQFCSNGDGRLEEVWREFRASSCLLMED